MDLGFPTVSFWCDNGGKFHNTKMEKFVNKLDIKIECTLAFSPQSNGVNEKNYYRCDVIVRKIMEEDKKISLKEAVSEASWTHNQNVNMLGYSPMQLVTRKNILFRGLGTGNEATDSL